MLIICKKKNQKKKPQKTKEKSLTNLFIQTETKYLTHQEANN